MAWINQGYFNIPMIDQPNFIGKILLLPCQCISNSLIPTDAHSHSYRSLHIDCPDHGGKPFIERGQAQQNLGLVTGHFYHSGGRDSSLSFIRQEPEKE
mgnify:CR=1 FL=1